jgi:hypothetical protein
MGLAKKLHWSQYVSRQYASDSHKPLNAKPHQVLSKTAPTAQPCLLLSHSGFSGLRQLAGRTDDVTSLKTKKMHLDVVTSTDLRGIHRPDAVVVLEDPTVDWQPCPRPALAAYKVSLGGVELSIGFWVSPMHCACNR